MASFVKEFENYILSDKREDSLISIIPGSEADLYLQLTKALTEYSEKKKEPENFENLLRKLKDLNFNAHNEIIFKKLLKNFDFAENEKDEQAKEKVIKELKNIVCPHAKFNYTRPTNSKINFSENSENSKFPAALEQSLIPGPAKHLEKFYEDQINNFYLLNEIKNYNLLKNLNWEKVNLENFFRNWLLNKIELPLLDDESGLIAKIAKFLDSEAEKNKCFPYLNDFLQRLPIELLEKLSEAISTNYCDKNKFLNLIINKTHAEQLSAAKDANAKKAVLLEIYAKLKPLPPKYQALKANALLEILSLNILLNEFDLALFLEYIKSPVNDNKSVFKFNEEKSSELRSQERYTFWGVPVTNSDAKLIAEHLDFFFMQKNLEIKAFEEYLDEKLLKKHFFQSQILKGEESEEAVKHLGQADFERLVAKTEISICKHNKQLFAVEDEVVLELDVKNIQTLFVKIFEINTENYYYTQKSVFDTSLSLEGLVACSDETFIFNEKPQVKKRKEFKLAGIPRKRGLYIVEFIGGGFSSRAIIKKGSLTMISREAPLGKSVFILNEKGEICKPTNNNNNNDSTISLNNTENNNNNNNGLNEAENHGTTGIWFKGTFYAAGASGLIIIPYAKNTENDICILNHNGFSEISNLILSCESYALQGVFNVNHESLTMGNTAKFLFKPFLTLNGREAALSMLKNSTLTALVSKQVNGETIPTSQVFDKITLDKNQEFCFELQTPPKLTDINLTFEAEVFNNSKQEKQKLIYSYAYKSYEAEDNYIRMFLKSASGNYSLFVLGKNGEAKSDCVLSINLQSNLLKTNHTTYINSNENQIKLQTDQEGKVFLGVLRHVHQISAALAQSEGALVAQKWDLPETNKFSYPSSLHVLENEKIVLPVSAENAESVFLVKVFGLENITSNCTKTNVKTVAANAAGTRFNLEISALKAGTYFLSVGFGTVIDLNVHSGKYWDSEDFIITRDKIIENKKSAQKILSIADLKVSEEQDEVLIKIQNADKSTRLHIYAYQYLNPSNFTFVNYLRDLHTKDYNAKSSKQALSKWSNIYLDNRKLNDEIQYVFDRKNLERQMGNSLEKPSLLLKRKFIRDTVTEKEVLEAGTAYEKKAIDLAPQAQMLLQKDMQMQNDYCSYDMYNRQMGVGNSNSSSSICAPENQPNAILSYNNFLSESAALLLNVSAAAAENSEDYVAIKNLNLKAFSHLQIFAVSESSCYEEFFALAENSAKKRDLALKESLSAEKAYAELRIAECFAEKSEVKIDDITSTSFKIMDSLEKVAYYKALLNKSLQEKWNEFKFLLSFDELSEEEQKHMVTKYFSHELNVFLYFKYPQKFAKLVLPILKFKAEKTFIDFFLMGDLPNILKFLAPNRIENLSVFEKCLLVHAVKSKNAAFAAELAHLVESEASDSKNESELKKYFDILMNMKNEADQDAVQDLFFANNSNSNNNNNNITLCDAMPESLMRGASNFMAMPKMARMMKPTAMFKSCAVPMNESMSDAKKSRKKMGKAQRFSEEYDEAEDDDNDMFGEAQNYSGSEDLRNQAIRKNFDIAAGTSKEYCETHFLQGYLPNKYLTVSSQYWADLAAFWAPSSSNNKNSNNLKGFLSKNILLNSLNISDLLFTLAVLDLPFRTLPHKFAREGEMGLKIGAASNLILFTKTIKESSVTLDNNLMIAQSVYLNNFNKGAVENKNVTEFVPHKIYCHKTNVINLSPQKVNFDMLIQIPEGAVPVRNSDYTRTINQNLENNICEFLTYFYFPKEGEFVQYPPTTSKEGVIISKGNPLRFSVKQKQQLASSESLDDVLESGSKEDILRFFSKQKLIKKNELQKIYWILTAEKSFYLQITTLLRSKGIFDEAIWLMGFLHCDALSVAEYIENRKDLKVLVGNSWDSRLLKVDESNDFDVFNHLDYHPLLNARVHRVGQANKLSILNREFRNTYQAFIVSLVGKRVIQGKDYLRLCYYLILQDRIDEAVRVFKKINCFEISKFSSLEIQYDYVNAYLDFSMGYPDFAVSRALCKKYKEFPLEQ